MGGRRRVTQAVEAASLWGADRVAAKAACLRRSEVSLTGEGGQASRSWLGKLYQDKSLQ